MISTPSKSLKTEQHCDPPAPRITRRPSFGSLPSLKSGTGSHQQLLHVLNFTHALSVFDSCQNCCKVWPSTPTQTHSSSRTSSILVATVCEQKKGQEANELNDHTHTHTHTAIHYYCTAIRLTQVCSKL